MGGWGRVGGCGRVDGSLGMGGRVSLVGGWWLDVWVVEDGICWLDVWVDGEWWLEAGEFC